MPGAYVLVLEDKQALGKSEQDNRPTPAIGRQKAVTTVPWNNIGHSIDYIWIGQRDGLCRAWYWI